MKYYAIQEDLRNVLIEYLSTRPLREVVGVWSAMQALKEISIQEAGAEKDGDSDEDKS